MAKMNFKSEPGGKFKEAAPGPEPANDNSALITATEWQWIDPKTILPRQWIYGRHYIRKYVSVTVSPGGLGKTAKAIVEALSMVTGRELLGEKVHERARVWLLNEDPREELDRRIAAACKYYEIRPSEIAGRLFVNSFRDQEFITAKQTKGETVIVAPFRDGLEAEIRRKGIDVMIVDPFVSTHSVVENDNMAIDLVIKQFWAPVIEKTGIAAELIHHSKKLGGNEVNAESARSAGSLIGAARSAIALNGMTVDEANKANVESRHDHFRATDAKANMAPKSEQSRWYKIESVDLANATVERPADHVGVVTSWRWPDAMQGMTIGDLLSVQKIVNAGSWKDSSQATNWVGRAVAEALGLDVDEDRTKERIKQMLKRWKDSGALKVETKEDENRKKRPFVVVGEWAIQSEDD
ncbi:AAA family ATPase [Mesorhizobium sp.]|uniref:AAA family ATPase n=1 Tax=Mesorhizobium sp. TaxID=1871066 RepID=UPI000FE37643|nr:AAA family ATPase [Mesorhizobium sp.]RWN99377.1 MAG: recombinase RecA [Mesorhizobium sp.]